MSISDNDLEAIVQLFETSTWRELELQYGDAFLYLSRQAPGGRIASVSNAAGAIHNPDPAPPVAARATAPAPKQMQQEPLAPKDRETPALPEGCVAVTAPSLGCFYQAPKPGADPYVQVGQRVEPETDLCLLEVMKLFTTVPAGVSGVVKAVLVSDGQMVEYGQPLFVIDTRT